MKNVRLAIIGTSAISEWFIDSARLVQGLNITAVYSRSYEKGIMFAKKHNIEKVFTDINELAKSDMVDAVYVAAPNYMHCEYSILMLENKKHVLCEKAFASNSGEVKLMVKTAKKNNVVLMEAMKTTLLPNFKVIQDNLNKIGDIRRYFASYCQYSSRYDKYKEGEVLNAFRPELSNGALMDIGVYTLAPMVALFGSPKSVKASALMLDSGVDGEGSVLCKYDGMEAVVMYSKISNSYVSSEIQGEKGSILIDRINEFNEVKIIYRDGTIENLTQIQQDKNMYYEISEFVDLINDKRMESSVNGHDFSIKLMNVMDEVRNQIGLVYPADKKKNTD